ncbi:PREDICTED: probable molybdopterin-synthase adenylyltransferase [Crocodylus porosus]|uniref:probable molybdopterin-synthase adenylyltransferase n=1 Tax=Crocodylus porosus TaxID=8502 RepID=UPI000939B3F8|nr:PREDICTED: probable molybdopterin-synthase adenylyltransferase [Crocodylus porosus]
MTEKFLEKVGHVSDPKEMRSLATEWVHESFPEVETVSTETLQSWIENNPEELLILDTRSPAEYEVSHLPGAILIDPQTNAPQELLQKQLSQEHNQHKSIICYCTVGYRASMTAQNLTKALSSEDSITPKPAPKIYNAEGGLAKWATERKQMIDNQGGPTSLVHPYSAEWAKLLEPELQAQI